MTQIKAAGGRGPYRVGESFTYRRIAFMPWSSTYYPISMSHLPPEVREKAIDIANALLEQGYDEGKAIRIAIAKAKQWARRHSSEVAPHPWYGPQ